MKRFTVAVEVDDKYDGSAHDLVEWLGSKLDRSCDECDEGPGGYRVTIKTVVDCGARS